MIIVYYCNFLYIYIYEWQTKLLNYSSQWAWPKWVAPYWLWRFDAMWKNRVSASGWTPIGCEGFHTNLNIPSPLPTTLVFRWFCWLLIYIYIYTLHYCIFLVYIVNLLYTNPMNSNIDINDDRNNKNIFIHSTNNGRHFVSWLLKKK